MEDRSTEKSALLPARDNWYASIDTAKENPSQDKHSSNNQLIYADSQQHVDVLAAESFTEKEISLRNSGSSDACSKHRYGWFTLRPKCLQFWNNPNGFLLWLCGFAFTQSYVTSGIIYTVTTTIEQRFSLPSVQSGFIASCYDLALLVVVLFVTYFGERGNKPLWLGYGAVIFGCGSFIFAIPHFTSGLYEPSTSFRDICDIDANSTDSCETEKTSLNSYYWVFVVAQCLHGLGAAPLYTLGVTYLDESVAPHQSSLYIGIVQSTSLLGPALGFLLGGFFLSIYTNPNVDPESLGLSPDSLLWIGAWWIGFLTSGAMALLVAIPLLGFPKYLPDAKNITGKQDAFQTQKGSEFQARSGFANKVKDIPKATLTLVTNLPFMLLNCSAATEWFIISCLAAFGPKFFESQFGLTSSEAAFQTGLIVIPSSFVGTLLGAIIVKQLKLKFRGMVRFCIGCLVVSLGCMTIYTISCPDPAMAGVTVQYQNSSLPFDGGVANFTADCNADCHCSTAFNPVCGSNAILYYSACHAGCMVENEHSHVADNITQYSDCECIVIDNEDPGYAKLGICSDTSCSQKTSFLFGQFFMLAFTFLALVPSILATIRSVSHSQRAYALGIQSVIYRGLGTVPGPIILGALIDQVCLVGETDCEGPGICWLYDNEGFSERVLILSLVLRCMSLVFLVLSLIAYRPAETMNDENDNMENQPLAT